MLVLLCGFIGPTTHFIGSIKDTTDVDLELILAVDTSNSMNAAQLTLQHNGYVQAFRHPELIQALETGPRGRIAVLYMEWAGPKHQVVVVPWTVIDEPADAIRFADSLAVQPLSQTIESNPGTSISHALLFAEALFTTGPMHGVRRVIDISGDGPNNSGVPVAPVRDALVAQGITINGLPIALPQLNPEQLKLYYEACVIGGPDAFTFVINDISRFDETVRRKLLTEIVAQRPKVLEIRQNAPKPGFDCSAVGDHPGR